jgi:hypothetical protein
VERGQTKQRVEELQFCLYRRAIHPELFEIKKVKRFEQRRYQAEVWVLGLAHVISVQYGNSIITELIADDDELLPKSGLATSFRFRGEKDHTQTFDDGARYLVSTQVERMTPQLFPTTHRDYLHYGRGRALFVTPDEPAVDGLVPFSFLDFDARDHEFHVHAFHVFPSELTILKTQSIFEIPRTPPRRPR